MKLQISRKIVSKTLKMKISNKKSHVIPRFGTTRNEITKTGTIAQTITIATTTTILGNAKTTIGKLDEINKTFEMPNLPNDIVVIAMKLDIH